jgi:nickel superoxide dismutase
MSRTPRVVLSAGLAVAVLLTPSMDVRSHCQIPCGIYDDPVRFQLLEEHIRTIEKSMNEIVALSQAPGENANQLIRWVNNKEHHADAFAEVVTAYFLQQRIKPGAAGDAAYVNKLILCHRMLVTVMKAKQTTDQAHVGQLRKDLAAFRTAYMGEQKAPAMHHEHHEHEHGPAGSK